MALFLKEIDQRSQLQNKIAADLQSRTKIKGGGEPQDISESSMLKDTQQTTGKSLVWVGAVTMAIIAAIVFFMFIYEG